MPERILELKELLCDFCGQADTSWVYPADDFTQDRNPESETRHEIHMQGAWNACDTCYDLIENDARTELLETCLDSFGIPTDSRVYSTVRKRVQRLHDEFFYCRAGDAIPEDEYEDEEGYKPGVIKTETHY